MKTRGSSIKVVMIAGVTAAISSLLLLTLFLSLGKGGRHNRERTPSAAAQGSAEQALAKDDPRWIEGYGKLPMSFEENQGQTAREVRYVSRGSGYELFLTPQEAVLTLRSKVPRDLSPRHRTATLRAIRKARQAGQMTVVRMRLEGANPDPQIAGMELLPGKTNYFIGNDPKNWHTDVPSYARVKYSGIYPGVDLVFYGNQRRLEYDFIVAPGADPQAIRLNLEGARKMRINSRGDLVLSVAGGEVELQRPVVYQNVKGERRETAGRYAVAGDHRVTFAVGSYDRSEPLIIDPVLNYSTYLGGSSDDGGFAIAVDASGNAFIAGQTVSTDFPPGTKVGFPTAPSGNLGASFVAEIDPTGTKLLYSSYLAGTITNGFEQAFGVAVDSTGKVYVTGLTFATDFPTTSNGLKTGTNAGNVNGTSYITKLDPTVSGGASLLYSSYLGGTNGTGLFGGDAGESIAVDANGIAYVAGYTDSRPSTTNPPPLANFPIVNGFQTTLNSTNGNAFLAKIDTSKSGSASLIYSTYLGGAGANAAARLLFGEDAHGVTIDGSGNAYLAGTTTSTDFPTNGSVAALQTAVHAGNTLGTAFVTKIDTTKSGSASLIYSTYLGGEVFEEGFAIALGPNNVAYVTGTTDSLQFPMSPKPPASGTPFQTTGHATGNAFVSLIDTGAAGGGGATLKYSTFLGGTNSDTGFGIRADAQGNAYVAGTTGSADFPFPPKASIMGGFEPTFPAGAMSVGFFSKLNPAGGGSTDLVYSTYFGGIGTATNGDHIFALAIDSANPANVYVTGQTLSTSATFPVFPTTAPAAFQQTLSGPSDAFVAKLTLIPTLVVSPTTLNFGTVLIPNTSAPQSVTLTNNTNAAIAFTSAAISGGSPAAANTDYAVSANTCGASIAAGASCSVSVTFKPTVVGSETATLVLTDADSTSPQNIALTGSGTNTPPDFTVTAPATATVKAGSSVNFLVTVTPVGGFSSAVALTCTGAPALATCTPVPASVTPSGSAVTSTVTVTTTAFLAPPSNVPTRPLSMRQVIPLLLVLLMLFLLPRTQRLPTRLGIVSATVLLITLAGCSGFHKPGTPKGTTNLTITGTSGGTTHTATVALTVN